MDVEAVPTPTQASPVYAAGLLKVLGHPARLQILYFIEASPFVITHGTEVKGNLVFGKLPSFTLPYGAAGEWGWEAGTTYRPHYRPGLVSPF